MLEIGSVLDGKYKILNQIGQGGMSIVYLAMNEKANKQWAVKEVRKEGVKDFDVVRQSLIMETDLLKQLKHPHLPSIADIIETDGTLIIVMDYIEGNPLSTLLQESGAQPQEKVVDWAKQLCDVFSYLHSQNPPIIYRDLKPANIMLKPDGNITLIDFGTARRYKEQNLADTTCLGTIGYAAPEQFGGDQARQTDARTDIYNLGATLYHLLTGKNPCEPPYEIYPIREWNPSLSTGLEKIIIKCTQKNPEDRFQSCDELMYALEHFSELDDSHLKEQKKKMFVFALSFAICFGAFFLGGYGLMQANRQKMENYNYYLTEASIQIAASKTPNEIEPDIIANYQKAIDIDASRSEGYIQLLDYYLKMGNGQTQNGLMTLSTMIASGRGDLKTNSDVMMKMAQVYFSGNAKDREFTPDYATAYQYFALVDKKKYPQAKYYESLAESLSALDPDWTELAAGIKDMENSINLGQTEEAKLDAYITLANVYRANASGLQSTGEKPFDRAIELLKKAEDILNNPYTEESIRDIYYANVCISLADSYYRSGNLKENSDEAKESFAMAISYYSEYMNYIPADAKAVYSNRIADIYRSSGEYTKAESEYKDIISKNPDDSTAYISYATMALVDLKNVSLAKQLYDKASELSEIDSNSNFQSLKIKMQNAGAI